jgi:small subunit ribosomal protein S20
VANSQQAAKRARQAEHRRQSKAGQRSTMRTFEKKIRTAIEAGDKETAQSAFKAAQPHMDRSARKGLQHPNAVARAKSRLSAAIKALPSA